MAGHSHWAGIKIRKAAQDKKRGKIFSKISKSIISAVRQGGSNPESNLKLKYAIDRAREANMPKDNVDRAIKRGTGELPGVELEELRYEGFGPAGTAFMVEAVTDNRQRTAADIRHIFEKRGGRLASSGAVSWMFQQKGLFIVERESVGEDKLLEVALEVGAEDIQTFDDAYEVYSIPQEFDSVKKGLESKGLKLTVSELSWIAKDPVTLDEGQSPKALALAEALEEHEDVQTVYGNFEIADQSAASKQDDVAQCHRL